MNGWIGPREPAGHLILNRRVKRQQVLNQRVRGEVKFSFFFLISALSYSVRINLTNEPVPYTQDV